MFAFADPLNWRRATWIKLPSGIRVESACESSARRTSGDHNFSLKSSLTRSCKTARVPDAIFIHSLTNSRPLKYRLLLFPKCRITHENKWLVLRNDGRHREIIVGFVTRANAANFNVKLVDKRREIIAWLERIPRNIRRRPALISITPTAFFPLFLFIVSHHPFYVPLPLPSRTFSRWILARWSYTRWLIDARLRSTSIMQQNRSGYKE